MGEKKAKDFTLEEASALLLKDTNRTDSDLANYIIRQVDKILDKERAKQEKTVTLQFLGKHYDCGKWFVTTNDTKTVPESVALRLEKDFPKQWKRVKGEELEKLIGVEGDKGHPGNSGPESDGVGKGRRLNK